MPLKIFRKKTPGSIEEKIGYKFKNRALLQTALTHRSAAQSQNESYERLEFLGDAILDLVVSDHLYQKHPAKSEGQLTQMRSMLVNAKTLHEVALSIQLQRELKVDRSIDLNNSPAQRNLLSCSLEAIIGAIYLDRGMRYAEKFIKHYIILNKEHEAIPSEYNYKGQLFEYCQKHNLNPPEFRTESVKGPDHARHYTIVVYINNSLYGTGTGNTKRVAEQQAAEEAFKVLLTTK
ncbi:MAG: ribonuclease III [Candidatus Marinimicrobia bacterium]|nr:ribonuclease III [Candidatus Neomarinimicrobiota bacterium]